MYSSSVEVAMNVLSSEDKVKLFSEVIKQSKYYNVEVYHDAFVVMINQGALFGFTVLFDKLPNIKDIHLQKIV